MAKIIKGYFMFVMAVSSIALLSYNQKVEDYIVSVLHVGETTSASSSFYGQLMANVVVDYDATTLSSFENELSMDFSISNNPENSFATPGSSNVELMRLNFTSAEEPLVLKDFRLKVVGVDVEKISNVMLLETKKVLKTGKRDGEYFNFKNVDYSIDPGSKKSLFIFVSLSEDLHTGERFRMDIEKPEDISLEVASAPYLLNAYYPIEGKYLSVVKQRAWSTDWNKKK